MRLAVERKPSSPDVFGVSHKPYVSRSFHRHLKISSYPEEIATLNPCDRFWIWLADTDQLDIVTYKAKHIGIEIVFDTLVRKKINRQFIPHIKLLHPAAFDRNGHLDQERIFLNFGNT
ncbi:hypothetical protein D3C85_1352700 [compost metagenome]